MSSVIRKISIGADYKNNAMHYSVGQEVYGNHIISHILFEEILAGAEVSDKLKKFFEDLQPADPEDPTIPGLGKTSNVIAGIQAVMDITASYPEPKAEGPYSIKVEDVKIADIKF